MSDPPKPVTAEEPETEPLARLVRSLRDQMTQERSARDRFEGQVIPLLERIALALERGGIARSEVSSQANPPAVDRSVAADVRAAIDDRRWDRAQAILDGLDARDEPDPQVFSLTLELNRARDRAIADLADRIEAARLAGDAAGGMAAREELAQLLDADALKAVDRSMIAWLMKLIQRRLRSIPIGSDLAALATEVANRFGGTPEGASLRAALPTLRRSAGLCPRCAEPYLGVDDACPKCLAEAGQTPSAAPTLTFVTDDLDAVVSEAPPVDLNNVEIWQLP